MLIYKFWPKLVVWMSTAVSMSIANTQYPDPWGPDGPPWFDKYASSNWTVTYEFSYSKIELGWCVLAGIDVPVVATIVSQHPDLSGGENVSSPDLAHPLNLLGRSHQVSSSFTGTYRATLIWNSPYTKPEYIYVRETSTASTSYLPTSGSGSASNAVCSPATTFGPDEEGYMHVTSSGSRLTRVVVPSSGVIVLDEVSLNASSTATGPIADASSSGIYSVNVEPKGVEIGCSTDPTYYKGTTPGHFGHVAMNLRRPDGSIDIDLATTTYINNITGTRYVSVDPWLLCLKYGHWYDPYHKWNAWGYIYSDGFTERTNIPAREDTIWQGSEADYHLWLSTKIKGTLGLSSNIILDVTEDGGSGVKVSNQANLRLHLPQENTAQSAKQIVPIGAWAPVSSIFTNNGNVTLFKPSVSYAIAVSISAGVSGQLKVDLKVIEYAFSISLTTSITGTITSYVPLEIPAGFQGAIVARPIHYESTLTYDNYEESGFNGIVNCIVTEHIGPAGLMSPSNLEVGTKVWPNTGIFPTDWTPN